jgi:hypothetical protein
VLVPLGGDGVASERSFSQGVSNLAEYDMEVQLAQVSMPSVKVFHSFANVSVNKMLFTNIKMWHAKASSSKLGQW